MAVKTFGTTATTSLSAVQWHPSPNILSNADLAAFNVIIQANPGSVQEDNPGGQSGRAGTYLSREGILNIPGRGFIKIYPNDWVCVDPTVGFPFVVSQKAVTSGPYTHS